MKTEFDEKYFIKEKIRMIADCEKDLRDNMIIYNLTTVCAILSFVQFHYNVTALVIFVGAMTFSYVKSTKIINKRKNDLKESLNKSIDKLED